jgi:methionyl-tRNA formyltransferase
MNISILCSDVTHPIYPWLESWAARHARSHVVELLSDKRELRGGDVLFLVSCSEIIDAAIRSLYRATLVIHASDLPEGRGWSPHIWQILEGKNQIKVTLLEAEDAVDSGKIWAQRDMVLEGHELFDEINSKLFMTELELMEFAVTNFETVAPLAQDGRPASHYRKRTPDDSRLDTDRTLAEQFDLLRVADGERFPAFFDFRGHRYYVQLRKGKQLPDE